MLFYAGITHVKLLTTILRERLLPTPGEVTVRRGQEVTPVQVIARTPRQASFTLIYGSKVLGVPPAEVGQYLLVQPGDVVEQGTPLLRKKGSLGSAKVVKSPVDGILYQVNNGRLILQKRTLLFELRALMAGEVAQVFPNQGVLLETQGSLIQAVWDSGKDGTGKIHMAVDTPEAPLTMQHVGADARGLVLVAGHVDNVEVLRQLEDNGGRGVIVGSMPAALCRQAHTYSFPILVTDGIGRYPMAAPIFDLLQQSTERVSALFCRQPTRHHSRPEIIIPLPTANISNKNTGIGETIDVGQKVRILRPPFQGQVGEVENIYLHTRVTDLGARVPGADVRLPDGQVIFVPHTNLDLICG
ncbi:MAG: hypothetical protein H6650_18560 [Ardenticatenales bacterium]|nr:hypothetical protein [Ardenticatenales bacterium]